MRSTTLRLTGLIAAALAAVAGPGLAQPAPAAAPPTYGPPLAGVCVLSKAQALATSAGGVSATQQLKQFGDGIRAELDAEGASIANDDRALAGLKPSLPAAEFQQRVDQLKRRYAQLQQTTRIRDAQLEKTRNDALSLIYQAMAPSISEVITARHCSAVFERAGLIAGNPSMDISAQVIERMNTRLTTVTLRLASPESVTQRPAAPPQK